MSRIKKGKKKKEFTSIENKLNKRIALSKNPHIPPASFPSYTEDVRRMEYLNCITELSGSTEGNELGSLGTLSQDLNDPIRYDVEYEETEEDNFEL